MTVKITIKQGYILVEPSKGIDFWEIYEGVGKLLKIKEFPEKNDIWVFREGPSNLVLDNLFQLSELVDRYYPKGFTGHKTAIVAETGIQTGLAKMYAKIVEYLPFEIRIFQDIQSAEDWVKND